MFVRLTTLDPNDEADRETLSSLINELKRGNAEKMASLTKENNNLIHATSKLQ